MSSPTASLLSVHIGPTAGDVITGNKEVCNLGNAANTAGPSGKFTNEPSGVRIHTITPFIDIVIYRVTPNALPYSSTMYSCTYYTRNKIKLIRYTPWRDISLSKKKKKKKKKNNFCLNFSVTSTTYSLFTQMFGWKNYSETCLGWEPPSYWRFIRGWQGGCPRWLTKMKDLYKCTEWLIVARMSDCLMEIPKQSELLMKLTISLV